uniref:Uncharacterized protein n=1 Tax=Arundo donax TaxID=35708 RepID=A0A0A9A707_ARUDO
MGGMMEDWHQKLHNNTSPDDVVICQVTNVPIIWHPNELIFNGTRLHILPALQALVDYLNSNLDIKVYWDTLNKNGITKERLLSYDHPIHSEPNLRSEQKEGLLRDLTNYMRSLKVSFILKHIQI